MILELRERVSEQRKTSFVVRRWRSLRSLLIKKKRTEDAAEGGSKNPMIDSKRGQKDQIATREMTDQTETNSVIKSDDMKEKGLHIETIEDQDSIQE